MELSLDLLTMLIQEILVCLLGNVSVAKQVTLWCVYRSHLSISVSSSVVVLFASFVDAVSLPVKHISSCVAEHMQPQLVSESIIPWK